MAAEDTIRRLLGLDIFRDAAEIRSIVGVDADAAMTPEEIRLAKQAGLWQRPLQAWQVKELKRLGIIPHDIETARA